MRKLLLKTIMLFAVLLPLSQVQAAGVPGKAYGGFVVGQKFKLKVTKVYSTVSSMGKISRVPISQDFPKFKKGQKVKFKIGAEGQLKGPGFSLPYSGDHGNFNTYVAELSPDQLMPNAGEVFKNGSKPTKANLSFNKTSGSGSDFKIYNVTYSFK